MTTITTYSSILTDTVGTSATDAVDLYELIGCTNQQAKISMRLESSAEAFAVFGSSDVGEPADEDGVPGVVGDAFRISDEPQVFDVRYSARFVRFIATDADTDVEVFAKVASIPTDVAPAITTAPTIAGTIGQGNTLTLTPGNVTGNPTPTTTVGWFREPGGRVEGAEGLTYLQTHRDGDRRIYGMQYADSGVTPGASRATALTTAVPVIPIGGGDVEPEPEPGFDPPGLTTVETGYANNVDHMATSNVLPATDDFTLCAMFIAGDPTNSYSMIFSKGFAASGFYITQQNSAGGRVMARLGGATPMSYYWEPDEIGQTMALIATRTAARTQMWLVRADSEVREMVMVAEDTSPGALVTNTAGPGIGNYQTSTTGVSASSPSEFGIIACGYGSSALSDAQIQQLGADMVEQGTIPTDFPGAVSVYQAGGPGGMAIDQVGSNDLTTTGGPLTVTETTPDYPGEVVHIFAQGGQSNEWGDTAAADFATIGDSVDDYTVAFSGAQFCRFAITTFEDLDDNGSAIGTAAELSMLRVIAEDTGVNYVPHGTKYAVHGTNLYSDWDPDTGARYAAFVTHLQTCIDNLPALTRVSFRGMFWWQGESDGVDGQHAAYEANLNAFIDAIRAEFAAYLHSGWRFFITRLSPTGQTSVANIAAIAAAQDAVHAARSDTRMVTVDALPFPDTTHTNAKGYIAHGTARANAFLTDTDQAAVELP